MKEKLFVDFDSTITDSITAYCRLYTYLYADKPGFKIPIPSKTNCWDFQDTCPMAKDNVEDMFSMKEFFQFLDFMPDAREAILKLKREYEIYICTIGTPYNLYYKINWLQLKLPEIDNLILIANGDCSMHKETVNMENAIFLDDNSSCLFSSNAKLKLCFGAIKKWNEDWDLIRLTDWKKVEHFLL